MILFFRIIHVISVYMAVAVACTATLPLSHQVFWILCLVMGPGLILDRIHNGRKRKLN